VRSKKRVHCFVAGELLLVFKYVIDVWIGKLVWSRLTFISVIGQVFQELWQFDSRDPNSRNLRAFLIHFIPDPVFGIMLV